MQERTSGDGDLKSKTLSTEEYEVTLPEVDETNEDLIGLSVEEYEKKRREEEHLREECGKMIAEGERLLKKKDFPEAEKFFRQANTLCPDDERAKEGTLQCVTKNFENLDPLLEYDNAAIAENSTRVKKFVKAEAGERLEKMKERFEAEAAPLREKFLKAQAARRESFRANRKYYLIRSAVFSVLLVALIAACIASAVFIPRSKEATPVILTIAFAALSVILLLLWLVSVRKLFVAHRLCRENERMSSTEEGARLEELENALTCLSLILGEDKS